LPTSIEAAASTTRINDHLGESTAVVMVMSNAKLATFETDAMNAAAGAGAPS
jgi:hypothetical protein